MSTLPCPSCGQMIFGSATKCRFCSADIDPKAAAAGAQLQAQVNNACNQAKMIRHMATAMWVLLLVGLLPFFAAGKIGVFAFFFGVPVSLILWQVKYGRIQTADPDFQRAKRDRLIAIALWLPAGLLQIALLALSALAS